MSKSKVNNNSSSEDEFIIRGRPKTTNYNQESEFTDEEYGYSDQGDLNPLFEEIFGTGNEYNYIYDSDVKADETHVMQTSADVSEIECCKYVNYILGLDDDEIIKRLYRNEPPEFVSFQLGLATIKQVYYVNELISDYRKFCELKLKKPEYSVWTYRALLMSYRPVSDLEIPGLLDISKYLKNLSLKEKIYEPEGVLENNFELTSDFNNAVNQLSSNPSFVDIVYSIYEKKIIEFPEYDNLKIFENIKLSNDLSNLIRFYCDSKKGSHENEVRSKVIFKAFESINNNCFFRLREQLVKLGIIEGMAGLQDVSNILVSLRGKPGPYVGIYLNNKFTFLVKINEHGAVETSKSLHSYEIDLINEFIGDIQNIVITSNTPRVKNLISNIHNNVYYVPKKFCIFKPEKDFEVAIEIAQCIQNPVIYFSRAIHENISFTLLYNIPIKHEILAKAICITAASEKLDWVSTLKHPYGFNFFKILGITLSDRKYDYDVPSTLKSLENVFTLDEINKIFTYFKLNDSTNLLDSTNLHPVNYEVFKVIAEVSQGKETSTLDEQVIIKNILDNPVILNNLNVKEIAVEGYTHPDVVRKIAQSKPCYFDGAPDKVIFEDVVPQIIDLSDLNTRKNLEMKGFVIKVNPDSYLVNVDGAIVFCMKLVKVELNQMVKVRIISVNYSYLSYQGEILSDNTGMYYYKEHRFYTELSNREIRDARVPVSIKSSSVPGHCLVIIHIQDDIFFTYKLSEREEKDKKIYELLFCDRLAGKFATLDIFINNYIGDVKEQVERIKKFKHYKEDSKEAYEYMKTADSQYLKYCLFLSRTKLGTVEILFGNKQLFAYIQGRFLIFGSMKFESIEDLCSYMKKEYKSL